MDYVKDMDDQAPGGVYLCQISDNISCGACCGLYNVADPSEEALTRMLIRRTTLFRSVPRDCDAIEDFGRQMTAESEENRPFPEFHHCPYTGLIGSKQSRVGCLLHPQAGGNNGADFRGLSFYGGMACRRYFCPTHHRVPKAMRELIRRSASDWYSFGLIVTEADFLCAVYDQLRSKGNGNLSSLLRNVNGKTIECIRQLTLLKLTWPFQPNPETDRVNYFFKDRLYLKPDVRYEDAAVNRSRYEEIFKNLVSVFRDRNELREAENMIDSLMDRMSGIAHSA
ncbi:hypothetical protein ACFL0O_06410 [Thermodesulfobacteriota bacterium]